jgi:hypothetical protein
MYGFAAEAPSPLPDPAGAQPARDAATTVIAIAAPISRFFIDNSLLGDEIVVLDLGVLRAAATCYAPFLRSMSR